jgi:NifU-like protein involved in Fe-S cluster formation
VSDPLYRKEVLRLAADAHGAGHLSNPRHTGIAHNPTCGDKVSVELALDSSGHITALAHETKACVLSQASASILGRDLKGHARGDVEKLRDDVTAMLNGGSVPAAPFGSYSVFDGVADVKARHRCVLLPIEAVLKAFES